VVGPRVRCDPELGSQPAAAHLGVDASQPLVQGRFKRLGGVGFVGRADQLDGAPEPVVADVLPFAGHRFGVRDLRAQRLALGVQLRGDLEHDAGVLVALGDGGLEVGQHVPAATVN
jgi:hypothetical protein